jgi:hypothetical protein
LGHSERPVGVRKSWLRRLAVRCLEWRRFGLGIAVSLSMGRGSQAKDEDALTTKQNFSVLELELGGQIRKSIPLRVGRSFTAGTGCKIQILTTARAKPFAIFFAEGTAGQGE